MAEGRTSLNFEDAMYCIKIPWELCMNKANNQITWRKGGLRPFSRPPAVLVYMAGDEASGSGDGELGQRRERWWGGWCRHGDGRNRTAPLEEGAGHCTSGPRASSAAPEPPTQMMKTCRCQATARREGN